MRPDILFLASALEGTNVVSALIDVALVAGFALLAIGIVVRGPLPLAASALFLFLAAIPLSMGIYGLPVGAASAAALLAARLVGPADGAAIWLARGVGGLAGGILAFLAANLSTDAVGRLSSGVLAYSVLMLLVLVALVLAGWWPRRAAPVA